MSINLVKLRDEYTQEELQLIKQKIEKRNCERSLHQFLKYSWKAIEGDLPFIDNWHLRVIAEHLELCYSRKIRNILINLPPRSGKTSLISISFPIWVWIQNPQEKFMFASYAKSLSLEHALKARRLIESDWFQNFWGNNFQLTSDQNTKSFFSNNKGGYRISTSVGAAATGSGANFLVLDDPNASGEGLSKVKLEGTNNWFQNTWITRLNDPKRDVNILVQQRIHANDLTGYIISNDVDNRWIRLILPMEFESNNRCITVPLPSTFEQAWQDPRQKEGALLFPARFGVTEVLNFQKQMGEYGYSGNFQQRPSPLGGSIIKRKWFKIYNGNILPKDILTLQSYDTAFSDKPNAAYSACSTFLIYERNGYNNLLLLSCWRGRVGYPELRERAVRLFKNYLDREDSSLTTRGLTINKCIIEEKATGSPLILDLKRAGLKPIGYLPRGDKISRVQTVSPYIEAGLVQIVNRPENLEFLDEICMFPNTESRDFVDTLSQALAYLRDCNMLAIPKDPDFYVTTVDNEIPYFKNL